MLRAAFRFVFTTTDITSARCQWNFFFYVVQLQHNLDHFNGLNFTLSLRSFFFSKTFQNHKIKRSLWSGCWKAARFCCVFTYFASFKFYTEHKWTIQSASRCCSFSLQPQTLSKYRTMLNMDKRISIASIWKKQWAYTI